MTRIKRIAALCLALLLLPFCPAQAEYASIYTLGSQVADFTLVSSTGETLTLSELLKEKDAVVLNFWASWCGPCEMEFPYLQSTWANYADRIALIGVSVEPTDDDDALNAYAASHGLTFPLAQDIAGLSALFSASSIPTTVVIDRFSRVGFMHAGAITEADAFARLFDGYVGEGYTDTLLLESIPAMQPNIPKAEVAALTEYLGSDPTFAFSNPTDIYTWPMVPAEMEEGRPSLMSTNTVDGTSAAVNATFSAKAGDVLAVTFKLSSEPACDFFRIRLNGETVKVFSGERDWTTYAYAIPADGDYALSLVYQKDASGSAGEDAVYIDAVALLSGDEAAAALAANPAYPVGSRTDMTIATPGARQIIFDDPTYAMMYLFGMADYYIVPGGSVTYTATLAEELDPEAACFAGDAGLFSAVSAMNGSGYTLDLPLTAAAAMTLVPHPAATLAEVRTIVCFPSEEAANDLATALSDMGYGVNGWAYAQTSAADETPAIASYTITLKDEAGQPVVGAMANICDETTCTTLFSDENGVISFQKAPYAYDVHLIKVPAGYAFDASQAIEIPVNGGEVTVTVPKAK